MLDLKWRTDVPLLFGFSLGSFQGLIAYPEINLALLNVQADSLTRRLKVVRLLSLPISMASLKHIHRGRGQKGARRCWARPERTSTW